MRQHLCFNFFSFWIHNIGRRASMLNIQLHTFRSNTCVIFLYRMSQKMHFWTYFTNITVARTQYVGTICYHSTGDSLRYHWEMMFFTYDRDNDIASNNSAVKSKSAWWHKKYFTCNPNGIYGPNITSDGIKWKHFRGLKQPLPRAQIMARRKSKHQY